MKNLLLAVFGMLVCANVCAQSFSYSGGVLTVTVDGDLSKDTSAPGKIQQAIAQHKPVEIDVVGGGKVSADMIKACLYCKESYSETSYNTPNQTTATLNLGGVTLVGTWDYTTFRSSWNGFDGRLALRTLTLPKREDNVIPDYPFFSNNTWDQASFPITTVIIPEGYTKVGAYAFNGVSSITSVSFPTTLKTIGDMAFANLVNWQNPILNEGVEFIGNSAFALTSAVTNVTLEVPASVKYMGPGAFLCRRFQEVYFRGVEAPMCPKGKTLIQPYWDEQGTFGTEVLMGNGGFSPDPSGLADNARQNGVANRENYKNNDVYFSIMHYPSNLTDEQRAKYTDITKKYETWEGNPWGATSGFYYESPKEVGQETSGLHFGNYWIGTSVNPGYKDTYLGGQYIWPSKSQWERSYVTASNSLCWDGVTEYKPTLTAEQVALLREAGFSEAEYSVDDLAKIAYVGTRQFVLGNGDASSSHEYVLPVTKGGKWWTLCVPFNMTKKMVDESFGENTQVCRFSSVKREFDSDGNGRGNGKKGNHITLQFRNDVYKHKFQKDENGNYPDQWDDDVLGPDDDDIVIYAHEAYMVKPTKTDDDAVFVVNDYTHVPGSPIPTVVASKLETYYSGVLNQSVEEDAEYRFIGNTLPASTVTGKAMSVPQNSYYYGKNKASDTTSQFWFWPYDKHLSWPANKCIVQTVDSTTGAEDASFFFSVNAGENQAKQASAFGSDANDGNTTSVEQVEILAGDNCLPIYNVNGQLVSHDGSTSGLQKGIYVQGGKKYVVK